MNRALKHFVSVCLTLALLVAAISPANAGSTIAEQALAELKRPLNARENVALATALSSEEVKTFRKSLPKEFHFASNQRMVGIDPDGFAHVSLFAHGPNVSRALRLVVDINERQVLGGYQLEAAWDGNELQSSVLTLDGTRRLSQNFDREGDPVGEEQGSDEYGTSSTGSTICNWVVGWACFWQTMTISFIVIVTVCGVKDPNNPESGHACVNQVNTVVTVVSFWTCTAITNWLCSWVPRRKKAKEQRAVMR